MEGFERYSAERQDIDETIIASLSEIEEFGEYIDPKSLNLPKEFEKKDISDLSLEWSKSIDLISNREYYIPTNAIYHPYISKDDTKPI